MNHNHNQVNKLLGINFFGNHKNSIRLGWSGDHGDGYIKLYAYYYNSRIRKIEHMCDVKRGDIVYCDIKYKGLDSTVTVNVGENQYVNDTPISPNFDIFSLYSLLYFGGKESAPRKIEINVNISNG